MLQIWFFANTILWPFDVEIYGLKLGLNVVVLLLSGVIWLSTKQKVTTFSINVALAVIAYMLFSCLAAMAGPCYDKFQKLFYTFPVFTSLIFIGLEIGRSSSEEDWLKLQKTAALILLVTFAGFVIEMLFPGSFPIQAGYRSEGKYSGIFSEPSLVAYSLFPCILILFEAQRKQLRNIGILSLCGLLLISRSSTLLALIVVLILYRLIRNRDLRRSMWVIFGGLLILGFASISNYDLLVGPTVERLAGVINPVRIHNLSSLAYLQGWQDAWSNLLRTNGLGLGFNMMGCSPLPDVPARATISHVFNMQINDQDGTFLFSKFVSETGIAGLIFFLAIIWWWFKIELIFAGSKYKMQRPAVSIQLAFFLSFVATSLIRSIGYFSGSFFLLIVAIAATGKWQRIRNTRIFKVRQIRNLI